MDTAPKLSEHKNECDCFKCFCELMEQINKIEKEILLDEKQHTCKNGNVCGACQLLEEDHKIFYDETKNKSEKFPLPKVESRSLDVAGTTEASDK